MLERKKIKAELLRVSAAKAEIDFLIEQKLEEIKRLEETLKIQELAEKKIEEKLKSLGG